MESWARAEREYPNVCRENENLKLDNEQLRKQILAYKEDLHLARRVLYFIAKQSQSLPNADHPVESMRKIYAASDRCIRELKQT
jgi:predicted RNase H-like nuclease (RuvC/YqgF family)